VVLKQRIKIRKIMLPKAQKVVPWEVPPLYFQQVMNISFKKQAQPKILQLNNKLKESITVHYFE